MAVLALMLLPLVATAQQVVVSQVYGGGGNVGATFKNDFIELFNTGSTAVNLNGWSVQYASATGTTWAVTPLAGTLQPGHYYLVQEAIGAAGTTSLPTPDATGIIPMAAGAGKVALVNGTAGASGTCPTSYVDLVGYGSTANCSRTAPTATLTNTTAAIRAGAGCTNTANNASDFATGTPTPRNTSSPANQCGGSTPLSISTSSPLPNGTLTQAYSVTFAAAGGSGTGYIFSLFSGTLPSGLSLTGTNGATLSGTPTTTAGSPFSFTIQVTDSVNATASAAFQLTVDPTPTCSPTHTIAQIQGSGNTSPQVSIIETASGIVTGKKSNGFFIQMPSPGDGDPATSDGVFVFTSSAPSAAAAVGNLVCVTGKVVEYIPSLDPTSPSQTEIGTVTSVWAISTGNPLPSPIVLTTADLDPRGNVLQLEKYEAMRVQVNSLTVVGPTRGTITETAATSASSGIFYGVITGVTRPFREPGVQLPDPLPANPPCCVPRWDSNPEVLSVNSLGQTGSTVLDVASGAVVTNLVGPLEFSERAFTIDTDPGSLPAVTNNNLTFTAVPLPSSTELTVASFNMQRFYDTVNDPTTSDVVLTGTALANRLNKASLAIRNVLRYPDVLGVEEMENLTTLQAVADKVNGDAVLALDPNPNYQPFLVAGNDIGGINVGFLVKTPKVNILSVTQVGKTTPFESTILNDRPPLVLVGTVTRAGSDQALPFTVIVNHLRSLSDVDNLTDDRVRRKREAQAEFLATYIQSRLVADPTENIVSVGDYNAYQFNDGYVDVMGVIKGTPAPFDQVVVAVAPIILSPPLTDLVETDAVPADQKYSYSYSGSAQVLDHVLVNGNMLSRLSRVVYARTDADFPDVYRNDPNRPERISDHDPVVAYFTMPLNHTPTPVNQTQTVPYRQATTFALLGGDPDAGDSLSFATTAGPAKGSVTYSNSARTATYTSNAGASGSDAFTYRSTDQGGLSATATVTLNIQPVDVTAQTILTSTGLMFSRTTHLYVGTVTVKNSTGQTIPGPVQLVFHNVTAGVTMANATGTTAGGDPYLTVVGNGGLAAGQSVTLTMQFNNPGNVLIKATNQVYSGIL